jgi:hypothetical protein
MSEKLHSGVLTSFSGGELTSQLAGRVDKEEMKIGSRYVSNFIPEHQGGLKKFYGSTHVNKVADDMTNGYKMIPFDGCGEPLCLLFVPGKVYCVTRGDMYQVSVSVSLQMMLGASYVQSNDVMYITNENMGQAVITYSGRDEKTGRHKFYSGEQKFVVEPFFPVNWQGNYNGLALHTSASTGAITITGQQTATVYSVELPDVLKDAGVGKNVTSETDSTLAITSKYSNTSTNATIGRFKLELHRIRDGVDTVVQSAYIGSEVEAQSSSPTIVTGGGS